MLAGPFLALFANLIDIHTSLHVLDRLILLKTDSLVEIIKSVFQGEKIKLLSIENPDKLH